MRKSAVEPKKKLQFAPSEIQLQFRRSHVGPLQESRRRTRGIVFYNCFYDLFFYEFSFFYCAQDPGSLARVAQSGGEALNSGHVIATPTDTIYGLAALVQNRDAVQKLYEIKGMIPSYLAGFRVLIANGSVNVFIPF